MIGDELLVAHASDSFVPAAFKDVRKGPGSLIRTRIDCFAFSSGTHVGFPACPGYYIDRHGKQLGQILGDADIGVHVQVCRRVDLYQDIQVAAGGRFAAATEPNTAARATPWRRSSASWVRKVPMAWSAFMPSAYTESSQCAYSAHSEPHPTSNSYTGSTRESPHATTVPPLRPAAVIAHNNVRQPHESPEYRAAREALLVEEIELNRHIARVAAQRRALPPGGEVIGDYQFLGEASSVQGANPVGIAELFGDKDTLFVYNWMYGPKRARSCPMCTALLSCLNGPGGPHPPADRSGMASACRLIERQIAFKVERGWNNLPMFADTNSDGVAATITA